MDITQLYCAVYRFLYNYDVLPIQRLLTLFENYYKNDARFKEAHTQLQKTLKDTCTSNREKVAFFMAYKLKQFYNDEA